MSLNQLFAGSYDDYFEAAADTPDSLWAFLHIPKTAGTSFRAELAQVLQPNVNIFRTHGPAAGAHDFPTVQDALDHFLARPADERSVRFVSGHLTRQQMMQIESKHGRVRLMTMLRAPDARVVSDYRYQRTPKHPPHGEFMRRFPTLESWVRHPSSQNKMFRFLRRRNSDTSEDVLADLRSNFAFVGLVEMYHLSRQMIFRLLNVAAPPLERLNKTSSSTEIDTDEIAALRPLIAEFNQNDIAIYEYFRSEYLRHRDGLLAYLRQYPDRGRLSEVGTGAAN